MSSSLCYYNCSEHPYSISPNPDISGVGVIIGYATTAGIVVFILLVSYFTVYDPLEDPFRKEIGGTPTIQYRPNPVDVVFLKLTSAIWNRLRKKNTLSSVAPPRMPRNTRLHASCVKCVQSMSDLQILTGTSILISGYAQLKCGLSAYHWQILVFLAWFSSLTHLSCLTFLRNYLYNRPGERVWRLIGMAIMLLMLLVAMVPTGNFNWRASTNSTPVPSPSDYAICYFNRAKQADNMTFGTMIFAILLLSLGFIYRIVRLHRSLSVNVVGRARRILSGRARQFLIQLYNKLDISNSGMSLRRTMAYRPFLALFLATRTIVDTWTSMFFEILWLLGSFIWGLTRLRQTLGLSNGGSGEWAFGQVISILQLAAPLLTISEYLYPSKSISAFTPSNTHFGRSTIRGSRSTQLHSTGPGNGWIQQRIGLAISCR
ncbi:uncharacterized protein BDR25DRAFT_283776 [Lindgomyces ingoldianus]|uniref:Uncharacterized protein n=1 Tax=Lindgomyces ingoldianus TaxID=673940 RepID=A0ACB6QZU4_9PLEO|nr:uncharacterized protein BDR25DRAFT_283776 [Lindgomyces ingoldianus]KAF2472365.1 hypothetical protein BDR25DRAFT_283776 [Lindgomyces ingoldianus]